MKTRQFFLGWLGAAIATGLPYIWSDVELWTQSGSSLTQHDVPIEVLATLIMMVLVGLIFAGASLVLNLLVGRPSLLSYLILGAALIAIPLVAHTIYSLSACDMSYWMCYVADGLPQHGSVWAPNSEFIPDNFHFWKSVLSGWALELGQGMFTGGGAYVAVWLGTRTAVAQQ